MGVKCGPSIWLTQDLLNSDYPLLVHTGIQSWCDEDRCFFSLHMGRKLAARFGVSLAVTPVVDASETVRFYFITLHSSNPNRVNNAE